MMHYWWETPDGAKVDGSDSWSCGPKTSPAGTPAIDPLAELQKIAMPESVLHFQPVGNKTLVNLESDFYTDGKPFDATVHLLNNTVTVDFRIRPSFTWHFGDGASAATTNLGAPVPEDPDWSLLVHHEYTKTGVVNASVDTTYSADYRVNGGPWGPVDGTVTKIGSPVAITVLQATPVLTD